MLAFTNAHLIDGTGSAPVAGATVLVAYGWAVGAIPAPRAFLGEPLCTES